MVVEDWRSDQFLDEELAAARASHCLAAVTSTVDPMVGQVVENRYVIEGTLGVGGMGIVYRARHVKVGREVAIKVLHDHLVADPLMVERFEREAALVAKLDHKNVVNVIDVGETAAKQKLMVLELARGEPLSELIARDGALAGPRVVSIIRQLLQGLEHAHAVGLVHRDLKPENVMVERDHNGVETPKIVDFGIAFLRDDRHAERRLTAAGIVLGTPEFMAPEQAQGREIDARCDLFALGVIMYVMLSGRLPFDGTGVEVAIANISKSPPPIASRSGIVVEPVLEAFARRLMARRLDARMPSARTALRLLDLIESDPAAAGKLLLPRAVVATPTEPMEPVRRTRDVTAPQVDAPVHAPAVQAAPAVTVSLRATRSLPVSKRRYWIASAASLAVVAAAAVLALANHPTVPVAPDVTYATHEEPSLAIRFVTHDAAVAPRPVASVAPRTVRRIVQRPVAPKPLAMPVAAPVAGPVAAPPAAAPVLERIARELPQVLR